MLTYLASAFIAFIMGGILTWLIYWVKGTKDLTYGELLIWSLLSALTGPFGVFVSTVIICVILILIMVSVLEQWFKQLKKPKWWDKKL